MAFTQFGSVQRVSPVHRKPSLTVTELWCENAQGRGGDGAGPDCCLPEESPEHTLRIKTGQTGGVGYTQPLKERDGFINEGESHLPCCGVKGENISIPKLIVRSP